MDRDLLESLYWAAVEAAQPAQAIRANLPQRPSGRTIVVGAGKASAAMAGALEAAWDGPLEGLVVLPHGQDARLERIAVTHAAHPVPDEAGLAASRQLLELVSGLSSDDLVIALISGGGSSLLPSPAVGLTLADEQAINRALLASGAPIGAMNSVRNQFSRIKGGRLAARAAPARVATLIVSDIPGDDPALVASGPTVPMASGRDHARRVVALYGVALPPAAAALLSGEDNTPPRPDDPVFADNSVRIVASAAISLDAAARAAEAAGLRAVILSDAIEGEAREVAKVHAALAREVAARNRPFAKPVAILSGGETTVTVRGTGRGGRNGEFMLSLAAALDGAEKIVALAADTDGIDGAGDNAGAFADGATAGAMRAAGLDPLTALANNDAYVAFAAIDGLFTTGPTGTNVNDFRVIIVR